MSLLVLFSESVLIRAQRNSNDHYETEETTFRNEYTAEPHTFGKNSTKFYVALSFVAGLIATIIWLLCKSLQCNLLNKIDDLCCWRVRKYFRNRRRYRSRDASNGLMFCKCTVTPYLYALFFSCYTMILL